ncbi:MAG: beta/gamma crystallin-related protein [Vicinamibacterales bacterium]
MAVGSTRVAGIVIVGLTLVAAGAWQRAVARPPQTPNNGITVYEDINFGGRSRTFTLDVDNLRSSGLNDRISSLVVARGESWEVCVDPDYRGRCTTVTGSDANLVDSGWNDRISSMRRVGGGFGRGGGGGGGGFGGSDSTLELYAGTNFSGQRTVLTEAVPNFSRINFNDRASSLRVRGGGSWEICVNADYDDCRVVSGNVPDLDEIGLRRLASSARPRFGRGGGGGGFPGGGAPRLVLYAGLNFTGTSVVVTEARTTLGVFNNRALSARVLAGRWEICDDTRFGGPCRTIAGDVRDLRTLRLDRRIESVRPR